jgi:hypothetical protein
LEVISELGVLISQLVTVVSDIVLAVPDIIGTLISESASPISH